MANLQNPIQKFFDRQKDHETVLRAKERFSYKPYHIENKDLFQVAKYGRVLPHTFSIITGLTFFVALLNEAIQFMPVSIGLSIALLLLWELSKSLLLTKSFVKYYATDRAPLGFAFIGLCFLVGSVYYSIEGAKAFYILKDTKATELQANHTATVDSLKTAYQTSIKAIESEIEAISAHKTKRWGGLLSASENTQIINYQSQIERLQSERSTDLQRLTATHEQALRQAGESLRVNSTVIAVIAAINEALILLICWFLVYYDYRAATYNDALYSEPIEFTLPTIQRLLHLAATTPTTKEQLLNITAVNDQKAVGFHSATATTKTPKETSENSGKRSATATTTPTTLLVDIANGIRDFRYLMNKHRVNVNTLKKAIDSYEREQARR